MDWINKVKLAMSLLQEACEENGEWSRCKDCPFDEYCTALMDAELVDPCCGIDFLDSPVDMKDSPWYLIVRFVELDDPWECDGHRTPLVLVSDWEKWRDSANLSPYDYFEVYSVLENGALKRIKEYWE